MAIDYSSFQNSMGPLQKALSGFQAGQQIKQARTAEEEAEIAKQEKEVAKAQHIQMQRDLAALAENKNASSSDYAGMMAKYPSMSEHFKETYSMMTDERKAVAQDQALSVFSALNSGQTDVAQTLMQRQIDAAKNSGDEEGAQVSTAMLELVKFNPDAAKAAAGLSLSASLGAEEFATTWDRIKSVERDEKLLPLEIKKTTADLGLTEAQTKKTLADIEKTSTETQKVALELEAAKSGKKDPLSTKETFEAEKKLRDEYVKRSSNFIESERNMNIIESSAEDKSGAGDIALITSFMKMLDPGSVVRETEFATAKDTAGLVDRLKNSLSKAENGEFLQPAQRAAYARLSSKYMEAAQKAEVKVRKGLKTVVSNYSLNSDNVFGAVVDTEEVTEVTPQGAASIAETQAQPAQGGAQPEQPTATRSYMKYSSLGGN